MQTVRAFDGSLTPRPQRITRRRLFAFAGAGILGISVLTSRLAQLQIAEGSQHRYAADNNRLRNIQISGQRGLVFDRNQIALVRNRPLFAISILPANLPGPRSRKVTSESVYQRLSKLIGGNPEQFARMVNKSDDPFTAVRIHVTTDAAIAHAVEERHLELPGVIVRIDSIREYLDGPLTSHVIGHVGRISAEQFTEAKRASPKGKTTYSEQDWIGQGGIEARFEQELRGVPGKKRVEVDASGREVSVIGIDPAKSGQNLVLSIDLAFQREVHRILAERAEEFQTCSFVGIDPSNGDVLSMVHLPAYDNRIFGETVTDDDFDKLIKNPNRPFLNGAVASAWPPGSSFKVIPALAALEEGTVKPDSRIQCSGRIRLSNGATRPCWGTHGQQDIYSALANSCDTYFYNVVGGEATGKFPGLGAPKLASWAQSFGLGQPTGIDLPGESFGNVGTPKWKLKNFKEPWYKGDDWISAIGQGFYTATPIQMAMVAATLANGGTLYRPRIALELTDAQGVSIRTFEPRVVRKISASHSNMRIVREGVRAGMLIGTSPFGTSFTGTSWNSNIKELPYAGKTGTAEYGTEGPDGKLPTHGWFIFWAPYETPRLAGAVFVKHGRGSQEAAKIASQIIRAYFGLPDSLA